MCDFDGGKYLKKTFSILQYFQNIILLAISGDCCLPYIKTGWYCDNCTCHETGIRHPENECKSWEVGDGICTDENNIEICGDYDGGKIPSFEN